MQPCVIDCCSLLHSFHLQLGGNALNQLMAEHFAVILHPTVLEEMRVALGRAHPTWRQRALISEEISEIRRNHVSWIANQRCEPANDEMQEHLDGENLGNLGAGEANCIALTKFISDEQFSYVLFLTDDYEAGETAKKVFEKFQCGFVVRSADIIIFFGLRFGLAKPEIHQSLRSLIAFYTSAYEVLLNEVGRLLPGRETSYIYPLVYAGSFERAQDAVARLSLNKQIRNRLGDLLNEMATLSAGTSVLAHSVSRLRSLQDLPA